MSLTSRDRKIVLFLVPVLLLVGYWFLLLAPKRDEAKQATAQLQQQEKRRDKLQAQLDSAKGSQTDFAADYAEIVRLGKAIPASVDMPSLLVQLDEAAEGTGIHFTRITAGDRQSATPAATSSPSTDASSGAAPVEAGGPSAQSAPGTAAEAANTTAQTAEQRNAAAEQTGVDPADTQTSTSTGSGGLAVGGGATNPSGSAASASGPAGLETVPLELEFVGNFFNLSDFFHDVKRFVDVANQNVVVGGRLVTIENVKFSSDPQIFPRIRAELMATIYLSPKAQGATAGATPQGPAPAPTTTPASGTPSTPSSTPAPTAAATAP